MVKIDIPMPNSCIECPFAYVEYPTDIPGCNIMECLPNCPDFGTRTPLGQKDKNCPLSTTPSTQPEPSPEIQEILNYLDTTLHPIVSPDNWYVYAELHDMVSMLLSTQSDGADINAGSMISRQWVIDELKRYFHDEYYQRTSIQDCINCFIEDILTKLPSTQPEIVRCKDCKHRASYWGNCRLLEEKYHQSVLVDGDSFCSMAEMRTDG